MNSSMKVPDMVKIAIRMNADIAIDGPASHSTAIPRTSVDASAAGSELTPSQPSMTCSTPRGSANQFGPLMLTQESTLFTAPVALKRNNHRTVIATSCPPTGSRRRCGRTPGRGASAG